MDRENRESGKKVEPEMKGRIGRGGERERQKEMNGCIDR